jgi:hypothetical protein
MFISIKPKPISNNSKVYLIKSFRDEQGKTKQRIIKDFGNYYELLKEDKHFLEKLKANVKNLETDFSQKNLDVNKEYNFGYFFIVRMILSMKLRIFILNRTRNKNEYLYK